MKRFATRTSWLGGVCLWLVLACAQGAEFWVTPEGNDAARGSLAHPFATLERAREAVRQRKEKSQPATVWIEPGLYPITRTFELTTEDSGGSAEAIVTWRATKPGEAVLDAGRRLTARDFKLVTEETLLARLPPEARGQVRQLDLASLHLSHTQRPPDVFSDGGGLLELYCQGVRQPLACWPNEGNSLVARMIPTQEEGSASSTFFQSFVFQGDEPLRWGAAWRDDQVWISGFWTGPRDFRTMRVTKIEKQKSAITVAVPFLPARAAGEPSLPATEGQPWHAWNLLEAIDRPGEWSLDFRAQRLYWWPPVPLEDAEIVVADFAEPLVRLSGASDVTWRGVVLQHGLGDGVEITGGEACTLAGCGLRRLGGNGVVVRGGTAHSILSCDLQSLGRGGILLSGGERRTLTPAGHVADNNHIWHYGLTKPLYSPGIGVGFEGQPEAVGCIVTHNRVHDSPQAAILYAGNLHHLELNEVYDFLRDSLDFGGFYTTHDWTSYGNVVRHNFVHHAPTGTGVYLDDGDSGDLVEGNYFDRLQTSVVSAGGHGNVLRQNIAIACQTGFYIDARGAEKNFAADPRLRAGLRQVEPTRPPWSEQLPGLAELVFADADLSLPFGSRLERNVAVDCGQALLAPGDPSNLRMVTLIGGGAISQPAASMSFADPLTLDFRVDSGAAIFQEVPGFAAGPFGEIGLYVNELRPVVEARERRFSGASE